MGGVPAKVIKYRFSEEIIPKLVKVDYSRLDERLTKEHINELYQKVSDIAQLSCFPRKRDI